MNCEKDGYNDSSEFIIPMVSFFFVRSVNSDLTFKKYNLTFQINIRMDSEL